MQNEMNSGKVHHQEYKIIWGLIIKRIRLVNN